MLGVNVSASGGAVVTDNGSEAVHVCWPEHNGKCIATESVCSVEWRSCHSKQNIG